jgi:hypothetical protein
MQRAETIKLERLGLRAAKSPTVKSQALVTSAIQHWHMRSPRLCTAVAVFRPIKSGQGGVDE